MQRETHPEGVPHQWHWATLLGSMSLYHLISGGARYARTLGYGAVTALRSCWCFFVDNHFLYAFTGKAGRQKVFFAPLIVPLSS
jgi:hypothetical protein